MNINKKRIIGRRVKYYAAVRFNPIFNKHYKGDELIIKGFEKDKKQLMLESSKTGDVWKLYPKNVRYLNNKEVKI